MKISYVLPVYNQQNTIAECVGSILRQNHSDLELIVIDDASTDYTSEILKKIGQTIKFTLKTNKKRMGAAKCRNMGNKMASGEVIAVCDADLYYNTRGEAIEDFFEANPDMDLFASALHIRDSKSPPQMRELMELYVWDFKSKCPISHPTVAYRRKVIDKVQYQELSKDTDLYEFFLIDCFKNDFRMNGCQNPLMCKIENNSTRDKSKAKVLKEKLYKKYGIDVEL